MPKVQAEHVVRTGRDSGGDGITSLYAALSHCDLPPGQPSLLLTQDGHVDLKHIHMPDNTAL